MMRRVLRSSLPLSSRRAMFVGRPSSITSLHQHTKESHTHDPFAKAPTPLLPVNSPERRAVLGVATGVAVGLFACALPGVDPIASLPMTPTATGSLLYLRFKDPQSLPAYLTYCALQSFMVCPMLLALLPAQLWMPVMTGFGFYTLCAAVGYVFVVVPTLSSVEAIPEGVFALQALTVLICLAAMYAVRKHFNGLWLLKFGGPFVVVGLWGMVMLGPMALPLDVFIALQIISVFLAIYFSAELRAAVLYVDDYNRFVQEREKWWTDQTRDKKYN